MDETLIHCNENANIPADFKISIDFPNGDKLIAGINIRPFAKEILTILSKKAEVVVFTASHSCYAIKVLEYMDPDKKLITKCLFREHCLTTSSGIHLKDLSIFYGRDLKDIVLVDNAAYSFCLQLDNGIPILPFYDNKNDTELKELLEYLDHLINVNDMRVVNRNLFLMQRLQ